MSEAPIKRSEVQWDEYFYALTEAVASGSKDPDRKVGAMLVPPGRRQVSLGYNGFPPEMPDLPSRLADREFKRKHMRHAEHNCLRQTPFPATGCTLYVTRFPCLDCAFEIRDAGVAKVVAPRPDLQHPRWGKSWAMSLAVLRLRGVKLVYV